MKKVGEGHGFDYIKFDTVEEIIDYAKDSMYMLYTDDEDNLYCLDNFASRALKFDRNQYKWVVDKDRESILDYDDLEYVDNDVKKKIFAVIPPFDAFKEYDLEEERKTLELYDKLKKTTPRKVIGWFNEESDELDKYRPIDETDESYIYYAAILNDIEYHKYFFIASWTHLVPVFDNNTCAILGDRTMGYLIGISQGKAKDGDYIPYTFGEDYWDEPEERFNKPKEGLYKFIK